MKIIKVNAENFENKVLNEKGKRLSQTDVQLINEQRQNGFIIVEQSSSNENVFYYRKKLKSGNKSSIAIMLNKDEIEIIEKVKKEGKKEKKIKHYKTCAVSFEDVENGNTEFNEIIEGRFESKLQFMNNAKIKKYHVNLKFIKEADLFDKIFGYKDPQLFSEVFNEKEFERFDNLVNKYKKVFDTKLNSIKDVRYYAEIILNSAVCTAYEKAYLIDFCYANMPDCFGQIEFKNENNNITHEIRINPKLFISKERNLFHLIQTIAHELAHIFCFGHSEKHRKITSEILEEILKEVGEDIC